MSIKIGIIGASGKMGAAIAKAVNESPDMDLAAGVGRHDDLSELADAEVVVDVTNADAARVNLRRVAEQAKHAVVGTSGLSDEDVTELDKLFKSANKTCFIVPNFSIGAVLMMKFAQSAAPYFDAVEVVEYHREEKPDAPSGTAVDTAKKIAKIGGRSTHASEPNGATGQDIDGVRVHAVRLPGLLAHQEVLLGAAGQLLTIRHDSFDRVTFMPGVLLAISKVNQLDAGVTIGLESILTDL